MNGVELCDWCGKVDDAERGQRCPCRTPHDAAGARRRLREAIARARCTDDVTTRAREAAAA